MKRQPITEQRDALPRPTVSVIAQCYNHGPFLEQTLDSIRAQTYRDYELIIVDDFSQDDSVDRIEAWIEQTGSDCRFIRHAENVGVVRTCNEWLALARGEFIIAIATDDYLMSHALEVLVRLLRVAASTVGAVYSDAYLVDDQGHRLDGTFLQSHGVVGPPPSGQLFERLVAGNFIPMMTTLIRRSCYQDVGGFDERLIYEDYDMWLRIARRHEIVYCDDVLAAYRILPTSLARTMTTVPFRYEEDTITLLAKHLDVECPAIRRALLERIALYSAGLVSAGHPDARRYLRMQMRAGSRWKPAVLYALSALGVRPQALKRYRAKLGRLIAPRHEGQPR